MAFGRPGYDVSLSNHALKEMDRCLCRGRLIEEFDRQGEIAKAHTFVVRSRMEYPIPSVCVRQARLRVYAAIALPRRPRPSAPYASTPKTPNSTWVLT
jgi:hypothetical protein